ncbi:MAG: DUF4330 domain-containing protein [Clostridia bacterium]|nr:DUF4330 domain-containing protein [Clostridia bacterium]
MIIDNKGRLFGKINLLDVFFILVLLAALAVGYLLFADGGSSAGTIPVVYTVEIQNQDAAYFEHINEGEQVIDGITKTPMGKIVGFSKEPAKIIAQADDKLVLASPENRFDGYVQIEANASVAYPDLLLDSEAIKIGKAVALRSESAAMHGYIVAMDYDEEQLKEAK